MPVEFIDVPCYGPYSDLDPEIHDDDDLYDLGYKHDRRSIHAEKTVVERRSHVSKKVKKSKKK